MASAHLQAGRFGVRLGFVLVLGAGLAASGCRHVAPPVTAPVGMSGFQFVERPISARAAAGTLQPAVREPVDIKVRAEPIEPLAAPVYPRALLGRADAPVTVGVRVGIGPDGRVQDIGPSLVAFSSGGEHAEVFRAAVEAAVVQWRFRPAEIRRMEPRTGGPGLGDYWQVVRAQSTEDACDVRFTFTSTGEVRTEKR